MLGVVERLPGSLDVSRAGASQPRDDRSANHGCDGLDRFEVAVGGDGEPGLNNVDAKAIELMGKAKLLGNVHAATGTLLTVAEGRIEDSDRRLVHVVHLPGSKAHGT